MLTLNDKFHQLIDALAAECIEREEEINLLCLALLARTHLFLLGKPGTAKSMLCDRALMRIVGARKYHTLVTKFHTDNNLIGPLSVPALKDGHYQRIMKGRIADCDVANIEEIWRMSGTLSDLLLGILNERRVEDDGIMLDIPLSTLLCSANSTPQEETPGALAAIWDRVPIRKEVHVASPHALRHILTMVLDPAPTPLLTWDEVLAAQADVAEVMVTDEVAEALVSIYVALGKIGIFPSVRRMRQCTPIVQAAAWLDGATKTDLVHLEPLAHCFWDDASQIPQVERVVMEVCSPAQKAVLDLADQVSERVDRLDEALALDEANDERVSRAVAIYKKIKKDALEVQKLQRTITSGRASRILADTWRRLETLHRTTMVEAYGVKNPRDLAADLEAE